MEYLQQYELVVWLILGAYLILIRQRVCMNGNSIDSSFIERFGILGIYRKLF